ncbi:MAG TPA: monovalent cation/H+ antiporter complex subunit F [Vicinamibacterales bacterium]|nr:monovalent cation/H+ antiporter complex subunit F [Vicinamibacterales bacterium]
MPYLDVASIIALAMLALSAALTFIRVITGPTLPDRVIAVDLIGVQLVCLLVVTAGATAQQALLDVAIVVALISFVGTVAYASYIERSRS